MSYGQRVRANLRVLCVYGFRIDSKIDSFEIGCVIYMLCCVIYSRNKNAKWLSSEFSVKLNCETRNEAKIIQVGKIPNDLIFSNLFHQFKMHREELT